MSENYLRMFSDALSDPFARKAMRKELLHLSTAHNEDNDKLKRKNEFVGICLSNYDTGESTESSATNYLNGTNIVIKARIKGVDDSLIPNPCSVEFSEEQIRRLGGLHRNCISVDPLVFGQRPPRFGDQLVFKSFDDSPDYKGRLRDVRYVLPSSREDFKYDCATGISISSMFTEGARDGGLLGNVLSTPTGAMRGVITGGPLDDCMQIPNAVLPVSTVAVTSGYKESARPTHGGIDFGVVKGTRVYSVLDGVVHRVKGFNENGTPANPDGWMTKEQKRAAGLLDKGTFGAYVVVEHSVKDHCGNDQKVYTVYGHVEKTFVKKGDEVSRGDVICLSGNEGGSTGPHLHFESWLDGYYGKGKKKNPITLFGWQDVTKCSTRKKVTCGWEGHEDDE